MNVFELRGQRRQAGQTLIIAMITLGLLLILGFVFLGIIDRNVRGAALAQTRSQANDLSEGGIRFAQGQLVDSPLGADWRGTPTTIPAVAGNVNDTLDPDAYYLRPAAKDSSGNPILWPNSTRIDFGGPDGLGPFIRWNAPGGNGRALIRVRYAPSDANILTATPDGPLRNPGQVHSYLQIESIGRPGVVNVNDPTTLSSGTPIQFQGFNTTAELQAALATMQQYDTQFVNGRHLLAFATPAITDYALFYTNKFNVSRAADIGYPNPGTTGLAGVGVGYCPACTSTDDPAYQDIGALVSFTLGGSETIASPATTNGEPPSGGSFMSNADVTFHGNTTVMLNELFGDKIAVNGRITGDSDAQLTVIQTTLNNPSANDQWNTSGPNTWVPTTITVPAASGAGTSAFDSSDPYFTTLSGSLLDGSQGTDQSGYSRGVGRLAPPSMETIDPSSQENRYVEMTRDSGNDQSTVGGTTTNTGINSGQFGHGSGVYVNNSTDIQEPTDETGRAGTDATESLVHDWLNPGNGDPTSGWQGPFYVPVGAYVTLLPDGFTIQLDNGTWKDPTGTDSGLTTLRYRIGQINGQLYIIDAIEPTAANPSTNVNGPATGAGAVNFASPPAMPFNGVLYFEGNVRIRGTIPTDVQLTVVSGATVYIEGSITKGAVGNDVTDGYVTTSPLYAAYNSPITRISKSSLMLMAKDDVAVNTTQFTGLLPGQSVNVVNDQQGVNGFNALRMVESTGDTSGAINLTTDFLTDPDNPTGSVTYNANNPSTWLPYALEYKDTSNNQIFPKLLFTHSMDDGTGAATFLQANINYGSYTDFSDQRSSEYYFPGNGTAAQTGYFSGYDNTATDYLGSGFTPIIQYGLGKGSWQNYPKYESRGFNLIDATSTFTSGSITSTNNAFILFAPAANDFLIRPSYISGVSSNDYLLAKAAVVPGDVRIEASVFAEEGSFFIIPGIWTSPNPNDTRAAYNAAVASVGQAAADQQRLESYGNGPEVPFYGEPLDIRVQMIGSVSENMPPPLGVQTAWIQKWGWIPTLWGGDNNVIPTSHIPTGSTSNGVPNFVLEYDPTLATGRTDGLSTTNDPTYWIRTDSYGRALLPMPRLPVSPALTYFGEVQ
jgi:hypothetical protein